MHFKIFRKGENYDEMGKNGIFGCCSKKLKKQVFGICYILYYLCKINNQYAKPWQNGINTMK